MRRLERAQRGDVCDGREIGDLGDGRLVRRGQDRAFPSLRVGIALAVNVGVMPGVVAGQRGGVDEPIRAIARVGRVARDKWN